MLIQFSVKNFGSYRDEQKFSFVAAPYNEHPDWVIDVSVPGLAGLKYLSSAGIYGANASGKSMLIDAFAFMRRIVRTSATLMPDDQLPFNPFRLDPSTEEQGTAFSVSFMHEGVRYDYAFTYTATEVVSESLVRYVKRTPQLIFRLERDESGRLTLETTARMSKLNTQKSFLETKKTSLLLSRGAQEGIRELVDPYVWISNEVIVYDAPFDHTDLSLYGPAVEGKYGDWVREQLLALVREADLGIVDISTRELPPVPLEQLKEMYSPQLVDKLTSAPPSKTITFSHDGGKGPVTLSARDESVGTLSYLSAVTAVLRALKDGKLLLFDEIDCSIHPELTTSLVNLFKGSQSNPRHAQLLFTSHTISLMDSLRRDQIWKTEKGPDGASTLEPLSNYHLRKDERKSVGYAAGRYGGIPVVDLKLKVG